MLVNHPLKQRKNEKTKETGNLTYIYKNALNKACFQHKMAYGDFKDLNRRTISDKVLRGKASSTTKNQNDGGYQRGLASPIHFLIKKLLVEQSKMKLILIKN